MQSVAVIIPTTGISLVRHCIESVLAQTYFELKLFIVIDGPEFVNAFQTSTTGLDFSHCFVSILPVNVGRNGFYGHRIYAAYSHLIDADYICFLDQDNWFEPKHISSLVEAIERNNWHWAFALRNIVNEDGELLIKDNSQSIGPWGENSLYQLVDTNCYCLRADVARSVASHWHGRWGQDRVFYSVLSQAYPQFGSTGLYTVNYRIRNETLGSELTMLIRENAAMHTLYPDGLPWVRATR